MLKPLEKESEFQTLFETMNLGVSYQNNKGEITQVNPAALKILDLTLDQMKGKTSLDPGWISVKEDGSNYPGESHPSILALKTGKPVLNKVMGVFNTTKNKYCWIKIDAIPQFKDGEKKPYQVYTTFDDITVAKETEHRLIENEKRYVRAQKMGKVGNWEYNIKTKLFWGSEETLRIFGLNPEKNNFNFKHIEDSIVKRSFVKQTMLNLIERGEKYDIQFEINSKNKKTKVVHSKAEIVYDKNKNIVKIAGVIQDISEKYKTKIKLKESEEKFFKIFKNSTNAIILTRLSNLKIVNSNKATFKVTGYTSKELRDVKISKISLWKSKKNYTKYIEQIQNTGRIEGFESSVKKKSGESRILKIYGEVIQLKKEKFILTIIEDVSEIRNAEIELKKQRDFTTAMTENQPSAIVACNADGKLTLFNKAAKEWHGVDIMNIPQEKWADNYGLFKTDGTTMLKANEIPLLKAFNGKKVVNAEMIIKAKNQKPRFVICNCAPFYDSLGNKIGALAVMNDITNQKIKEIDLKKNEEKIKKILQKVEQSEFLLKESEKIANVGSWEIDILTQSVTWSDQVFKLHGLPIGKLPSLEKALDFFIDGSKEILTKAIEESISQNKKYDLELKFKNAKKQILWINTIGYPITNAKNEVIGLRGVIQDITERKNIREKIKTALQKIERSEFLLNESGRIAKIGAWEYDLATQKIRWTNQVFKIHKIPIGKVPPLKKAISFYVDGSAEILEKAIEESITQQKKFNLELRFQNADKEKIWVNSIGYPILNKDGQTIGVRGVIQDITENKLIKKEIEKTQEMHSLLANNTNDLICLQEPDSTFKYISPSIKTLLGYEQEEFIGKQVFSIVHEDDVLPLKKVMKDKIFNDFTSEAYPFRALHKKGHFVWLEFLSSPVHKNGKINYFVTSARDITQWVLAKEEIQEYQTSLQKLTTEITLVEEKQKREIASNIHDHLSQSLVISIMKIIELKENSNLQLIDQDLEFIESHIANALENSRKITSELSPTILYQLGVIEALSWLTENLQTKYKIEFRLNTNLTKIKLNELNSILLYRSIQEVLTNAIKHAKATLVIINIEKTTKGVNIFIIDNGVGFDTALLNNFKNKSGSGFGLFTVKERIQNIQGNFSIISNIKSGTTIKIFIPLIE